MRMTARITTKQRDPIFNGHRDPRKTIYFFCELVYRNKVVADSGIWTDSERKAIEYARSDLANKLDVTIDRVNYHPMDYDPMLDGWGQCRVREPEHAARLREIYDEVHE
jgi:hypothetical protein